MSKELEMLESINAKLKINNKIGNRDIANKEIIELSNYLDSVIISLRKAPTSEEVCEALSEYLSKRDKYNTKVLYEGKIFHYTGKEDYDWYITETYGDGLYSFAEYLPPHLLTMLGKFYEGEVKKNDL